MTASHVIGLPRGADGYYVLEMLNLAGWAVSVSAAEGGVRVRARRGRDLVERVGATAADVALEVFESARSPSRGR